MSGEAKARGKGKKGGFRGKKGSHTEDEEVSNGIGNGHGEKIYLLVSFLSFVSLPVCLFGWLVVGLSVWLFVCLFLVCLLYLVVCLIEEIHNGIIYFFLFGPRMYVAFYIFVYYMFVAASKRKQERLEAAGGASILTK